MEVKKGASSNGGYAPEELLQYDHPVYKYGMKIPGGQVAVGSMDALLSWGMRNSLWVFPMATSCCGIELMAAAAARVDLDRMGTIVRATPRQADVMVVAGTITVKMAPRVRKLWDQMPEPKWCIAMGSCAISGDFYRNIYSVVPGIDTIVPVDVYIPGCPPNPEALMHGLMRLQDKVKDRRAGKPTVAEPNPALSGEVPPPACAVPGDAAAAAAAAPAPAPEPKRIVNLAMKRVTDADRDPAVTLRQTEIALNPGDEASLDLPPLPSLPEPWQPVDNPRDFAEVLKADFGLEPSEKEPTLVPADKVVALARAARNNGYTVFSYVVASHWPAPAPKAGEEKQKDEVEVTYGLRRPGKGAAMATFRIRVKADEPVDSLAGVYAGADWQEREQYDLVGVSFRGHPDLRRIMLPQAWTGHPLRREYPIDTPCAPWR